MPLPLRSFWVAAWLILLALAGLWSANQYRLWGERYRDGTATLGPDNQPLCHDFAQFVMVAHAWESHSIARIYQLDYQRQLAREVVETPPDGTLAYDPQRLTFSYPPFYCWLPRLLAGFRYRQAFWVWSALQVALAVLAVLAWRRELAGEPGIFAVVLLTFLVAPPTTTTLILGHVAFLGLLGFSGCLLFLNRRREFAAGLCLSLLFYKPIFGVFLGPVLLLRGRWRAVAGVGVGGAALAATSLAVGLQPVREYPSALRTLGQLASTQGGYYDYHFSWLATVATATGRRPADFTTADRLLWLLPMAAVAGLLVWAWRGPWRPGSDRFAAACSATVLATLFVSPYLPPYDLVLLAVAAVYTGKSFHRRPAWQRWVVLLAGGSALVFVAGYNTLLDDMPLRAQPTPLAVLAWFLVEVVAARTLPVPADGVAFSGGAELLRARA